MTAGLGIELKALGLKQARERFNSMQERAKNPKRGIEKVAILAWKDVIAHFRAEEGPDGKWEPLTDTTFKSRRKGKRKKNPKILQDSGLLRLSNRWKVIDNGTTAKVFNNTKYAKYHDSNEPRKGSPPILPHRKFMWLSPKLELKFAQMLLEYIAE